MTNDEIPAIDEDEEAAFASELAALVPKGASKVFVAGATGQTGRRVVLELRRRQVAVRAGVRDVKKAQSLGLAVSTPGTSAGPVELVKFDVTSDQAALIEAIGDADAVICATGFTPTLQNLGGLKPGAANAVDRLGTINLVAAAKSAGVNQFVLVTSLLTNAVESGQGDNQNYKVLNAFGGVLDAKHDAELNLRASGLTYTIVRPGGLSNEPPSGKLIVSGEDTLFGTDNESGREISRDQVAEICVEALFQGAADNKVIEIVSSPTAPQLDRSAWFDV
ncbi:hypothetical protein CYMTET_56660 [Cymbomonas tetramitiformis]|uniref:NAD(P)-binding domain-containing protein n=1 Tax=Cymbomonas tetramitiformis TaxID=36881 RepID=A0AAE0ELR2_9CHLO|nr:hypothetical protein CYMTET_56660 [Cymbomonas tetramitiformis]